MMAPGWPGASEYKKIRAAMAKRNIAWSRPNEHKIKCPVRWRYEAKNLGSRFCSSTISTTRVGRIISAVSNLRER